MNKAADLAFKACELILAVRACMMFDKIHADFAIKELLVKHGATTIPGLAKLAEDMANEALVEKRNDEARGGRH